MAAWAVACMQQAAGARTYAQELKQLNVSENLTQVLWYPTTTNLSNVFTSSACGCVNSEGLRTCGVPFKDLFKYCSDLELKYEELCVSMKDCADPNDEGYFADLVSATEVGRNFQAYHYNGCSGCSLAYD